jgi:hypothetical protein
MSQLPVPARREPGTVGGVLGIGDDEVERFPGDKVRQCGPNEFHADLPDDIADEEDSHAGCYT